MSQSSSIISFTITGLNKVIGLHIPSYSRLCTSAYNAFRVHGNNPIYKLACTITTSLSYWEFYYHLIIPSLNYWAIRNYLLWFGNDMMWSLRNCCQEPNVAALIKESLAGSVVDYAITTTLRLLRRLLRDTMGTTALPSDKRGRKQWQRCGTRTEV